MSFCEARGVISGDISKKSSVQPLLCSRRIPETDGLRIYKKQTAGIGLKNYNDCGAFL
jgi:hypothetical protein